MASLKFSQVRGGGEAVPLGTKNESSIFIERAGDKKPTAYEAEATHYRQDGDRRAWV